VYVADNGSGGRVQFTDIDWMYFDGTSWTTPAPILADNRAEFSPVVTFDGNGDAIAVWVRVRAPDFDSVDPVAFASQLEIVWSKWSRQTLRWSQPVSLSTTNDLNFAPQLAGPMADGSVLLTWTENQANLLDGEGPLGTPQSGRLLWSRWDAAQQAWSQPAVLLSGLTGRLSQGFAGAGSTAVYVWSRDLDGDSATPSAQSDQEIFYIRWTDGQWGPPTRLTNDSVQDANVRVAVGDSGIWLTWQRGLDLVFDHDLAGRPTLLRSNSTDLAFVDYVLSAGPSGRLAVIWQGTGSGGSNPWFRVYDRSSSTWSTDLQMLADSPVERSFAPVWDGDGNLTVAYTKAEVLRLPKTITLPDGGTVLVPDAMDFGRVDLVVIKKALVQDAAVQPGDVRIEASSTVPGSPVWVHGIIRNIGELPIQDLAVGVYDGDPATGGHEITREILRGSLAGGGDAAIAVPWAVPLSGGSYRIFVIADPGSATQDVNRSNNSQTVTIGGPDLRIRLISTGSDSTGAARVILEVRNGGTVSAASTSVIVRKNGPSGAKLATAEVGALEPGRGTQVAIDLRLDSSGMAPNTLFATIDEDQTIVDADRSDNRIQFVVQGSGVVSPPPARTRSAPARGYRMQP
jgi:hypothetical protein